MQQIYFIPLNSFKCGRVVHLIIKQTYTTGLHTVTVTGMVELSISSSNRLIPLVFTLTVSTGRVVHLIITWLVKHAPSHWDNFGCGRVVHLIIKQTLYHWASHCDSFRYGRVVHLIIKQTYTTGLHTVTVTGVVELSISSSNRLIPLGFTL